MLSNLPLYYISLFKILFGVAKKTVSIQRWFLKVKDINKQSIYKVAWNFLAVSKTRGRLGVGFIMTKKKKEVMLFK
jgi:hypothetical protein